MKEHYVPLFKPDSSNYDSLPNLLSQINKRVKILGFEATKQR